MKPMLAVLPSLLPVELQGEIWARCQRPAWLFGNVSVAGRALPFWKMDLDGEPVLERPGATRNRSARASLSVRYRCCGSTPTATPLAKAANPTKTMCVTRPTPSSTTRCSNGGVSGKARRCSTMARAWLPAPNRGLFFDSRIDHAGRPPSRAFGGLRVTIAFKLEVPR